MGGFLVALTSFLTTYATSKKQALQHLGFIFSDDFLTDCDPMVDENRHEIHHPFFQGEYLVALLLTNLSSQLNSPPFKGSNFLGSLFPSFRIHFFTDPIFVGKHF